MNVSEDDFEMLVSAAEISRRAGELGGQITREAERDGVRSLTVLWLAEGAAPFAEELSRGMDINMNFLSVRVSSYGNSRKSSGEPEISGDFPDLRGADVLVVDDILDTGATLRKILDLAEASGARSVKSCVLLNKRISGAKLAAADYVGFEIGDAFVFGFGMDLEGGFRNLPHVMKLKKP